MKARSRLSVATRTDLGLYHNVNNFLDFLRLSIVIWPHATSSLIKTVCAKWRISACITIILNMDMAMPKRWATNSIGCTSNSLLWLLLSFLFLTCKCTAVVFLHRAAYQWSGQRQRFSLATLQAFPAKVTCKYFLIRSLVKEWYFEEKLREKALGFQFLKWNALYKMLLRLFQPDQSICDLKTLITTEETVLLYFGVVITNDSLQPTIHGSDTLVSIMYQNRWWQVQVVLWFLVISDTNFKIVIHNFTSR